MRLLTRWTSADLLALPQDWGLRYEILNGELSVAMHPSVRHQAVCGEVILALGRWEEANGLGLALSTPGIILPTGDEVIPDVMWISTDRLQGAIDANGHFTRMPELLVEVLAPGQANQHRDRVVKLGLYAREGAREYWIVDPEAQTVQVYRFTAEDRTLIEHKLRQMEQDPTTPPEDLRTYRYAILFYRNGLEAALAAMEADRLPPPPPDAPTAADRQRHVRFLPHQTTATTRRRRRPPPHLHTLIAAATAAHGREIVTADEVPPLPPTSPAHPCEKERWMPYASVSDWYAEREQTPGGGGNRRAAVTREQYLVAMTIERLEGRDDGQERGIVFERLAMKCLKVALFSISRQHGISLLLRERHPVVHLAQQHAALDTR